MLRIYCPHCAEYRDEEEFHYAGQAHIVRPADPDACTDKDWGAYLYFRKNPCGLHHELWSHAVGCRKFLKVIRDTLSYEIRESSPIGGKTAVELSLPPSMPPGSNDS